MHSRFHLVRVRSITALIVLAPALLFGLQRTSAHAQGAAAPSTLSGAAVASSQYGPVSVVASSGGSTVTVSLFVGKQSYQFQVPARDFTQQGNTATLDTHGDLKSYGSIHVTWTRKKITIPASPGSCGSQPTPARTQYVLVNGRGTANLHLPCLSAIALNFGNPGKSSGGAASLPGIGKYQGYIGTFSFTLSTDTTMSLTLHKGMSANDKVDVLGFVNRAVNGAQAGSTPLRGQSQTFHTRIPGSRVQIQSDLGTGTLDFSGGPKQLRGTSLTLSALSSPIAVPDTRATSCAPGAKGVGATRSVKVSGTLSLHLCAASGSYPVDSSRTFASLYSSALTVKAPTPLKVVGTSPANNAANVPTSTQALSITFSNAMTDQNATATLQGGTDFQFLQKPTLDGSKKVMSFKLTRQLQPNTTYKVTISAQDTFQQFVSGTAQFTTGS